MWTPGSYLKIGIFTLVLSTFSAHGNVTTVLKKIEARSIESKSDTVLVVQEGRTIGAFGTSDINTPIETRSITKSFVSLAVGLLIEEGEIDSIDVPVYQFFPEWEQGVRQYVTVRDLLTHTSGMADGDEVCCHGANYDIVKIALATDFVADPGMRWKYNNKATNLLAGIVRVASGENVQDYLRKKLFSPMGITTDTWLADPSGNQYGMSFLSMGGADLAAIGILIAQGGCWNGEQLLPKWWITEMMDPSQQFTPFYSVLWWLDYSSISFYWDNTLIDCYETAGLTESYVCALRWLKGQKLTFCGQISYRNYMDCLAERLVSVFGSSEAVYSCFCEIEGLGLPIARWGEGVVRSVSARGFMGQQLIVMPGFNLIGVRLSGCGYEAGMDKFPDLECLLGELAEALEDCPRAVGLYRYGTELPGPSVPAYNYMDDPEFQKPNYPGGEAPYVMPCEKPIQVYPSFDTSEIPYFTPPANPNEYYQPKDEGVIHIKSSQNNSKEEYDFGSAFEGVKSEPHPEPKVYQIYTDQLEKSIQHEK